MKKLVGIFELGEFPVCLYALDGTDGSCSTGKNVLPEICVGVEDEEFSSAIDILYHELFEYECMRLGYRLVRTNDASRDHSAYVFIMSHPEMSNVIARATGFAEACRESLKEEWREYHKPKPKTRPKRKSPRIRRRKSL